VILIRQLVMINHKVKIEPHVHLSEDKTKKLKSNNLKKRRKEKKASQLNSTM
jgi:hypothetical protein